MMKGEYIKMIFQPSKALRLLEDEFQFKKA